MIFVLSEGIFVIVYFQSEVILPELPEVHQLKNELHKTCFTLRRGGETPVVRSTQCSTFPLRWGVSEEDQQKLWGLEWVGVHRRAKYLLFEFIGSRLARDRGVKDQKRVLRSEIFSKKSVFLLSHLGMTGQWRLERGKNFPLQKHDHFVLEFENVSLVYKDPRRFGFLEVLDESQLEKRFQDLGPEPLSSQWEEISAQSEKSNLNLETFRNQKRPIKSLLMDGKWVVGVGNIYACESLFRAQISPFARPEELRARDWNRLQQSVRSVLVEAVISGGSTIRDYVRSDGQVGSYQEKLWVYGREGEPCKICQVPIENKKLSGRSTFFCPQCQEIRGHTT